MYYAYVWLEMCLISKGCAEVYVAVAEGVLGSRAGSAYRALKSSPFAAVYVPASYSLTLSHIREPQNVEVSN